MKYVCQVCGYVHEGDAAPDKCPVCGAPVEQFTAILPYYLITEKY